MSYSRFFAFGCSFTKYHWPTWADYLAQKLGCESYNFGEEACGNEYIFHKLIETNATYKFTDKDLVIVCWTNFAREDRYKNNKWQFAGNLYTTNMYSQEWVKQYFDLRGALIKTSGYLAACTHVLEHVQCKYLYSSMMPMQLSNKDNKFYSTDDYKDVFETYKEYYSNSNFLPSMVKYLYDSLPYCRNPEPETPGDNHPSVIQHQNYVDNVILPRLDYV